MKAIYGLLLVGVSALALGGCSTSNGGPGAIANAILTSGTYNGDTGVEGTVSPASADSLTQATITDNGDDTVTVTVQNGGAVAGPRTYAYVDQIPNSAFSYGRPTDEVDDSILVAGAINDDAYAGFVAGYTIPSEPGSGSGNIAAGFGGVAPTTLPTGTVTYGGEGKDGSAVGAIQTAGAVPSVVTGGAIIEANFTNGTVNGQIGLDGSEPVVGPEVADCCSIGFSGTMSSSQATYSSNAVAYNGRIGTGNVIGGFYGVDGTTTAGAFNVQDTGAGGTGSKITGNYLASSLANP